MKREDFLNAGFEEVDDPQYKFEWPIPLQDEPVELDITPVICFDILCNKFFLYEGNTFIYINATSPLEAIEWARVISHFEPN